MNYQVTKTLLKSGRIIVLCLYLLFVLFPIYWMIATSFKYNTEIINAQELTYFPQKIYRGKLQSTVFDVRLRKHVEKQRNRIAVFGFLHNDAFYFRRLRTCPLSI